MKKWQITKQSLVYQNKFFSVREDIIELSDAQQTIEYYIMNFSNFVIIVPQEKDCVFLIKMYRYPCKDYLWEFPMGGIEVDELPIDAAKRELQEEAGILAKDMKFLGEIYACKSRSDQKGIIFVATDLDLRKPSPDIFEQYMELELHKFSIPEVQDMIKNGEIMDSHTIAAFQLFMLHYNKI